MELSTEIIVEAEEYFFSVLSKQEEEAERFRQVEEECEEVSLELDKLRLACSSEEEEEDLDELRGCSFWLLLLDFC